MSATPTMVDLPLESPVWAKVFTVAPLVLVGTLDPDGSPDVAPKHLAMPVGQGDRFCFVCTPRHATYRNAVERGAFAVSFPLPDHVVETSLAASARADDGSKPALTAVPTRPAHAVDAVLVDGCYLWLECVLDRTVDGFPGDASIVVGRIVAAAADERALRTADGDDADLVHELPLLAYLAPGRFTRIHDSHAFPFPADFCA